MASSGGKDDRGTQLYIVLSVTLGIAWLFALLRAYVRFFMVKNVAADDWWMFASMLAYTGYSVVATWGILQGGTGRHVDELSENEIYIGLKAWYISEILYAPVSALVRTSVALFLLRVSVEPLHKAIVIANLSVIWVTSISFMFVVTFQCSPPRYFFDQVFGLQGHCMDVSVVPNVTIAHSVVGAVCDLVFATLPIAMLWNVQMNKRTKTVIAILLGMGGVAGIALLVRIPFVKVLAISPDFLYETIDVAIWSVLEPSLGIIAGCAATFRPIFKTLGFGRNTTQQYPYGHSSRSRRARYGGTGEASNRTWTSPLDAGQKPPAQSQTRSTASPTAPLVTEPGPRIRRRWTWTSIHSVDIEMQGSAAASDPAEAVVKTRIEVDKNAASESSAEDSVSQGINVQTIIHTESTPLALLPSSAQAQQPAQADGTGK